MSIQTTTPQHRGAATVVRTLALCAAISMALAGIEAASASSTHSMSLSHVPAAVTSGQATRIAPLQSSRHLKLAINLPLRNESELKALLRDIYDPHSASYHHYLDVDAFTARFAPTQADYDAVVSWATAQGFNVTATARNRHIVDIEGSIDTINRALHVTMDAYRHPTENRTFFAPDREPTLDLAVPVLQITGLDDFIPPRSHLKAGNPALTLGPIGRAGGSGPGGQFLPSDMRAAYYGDGPLTGAGQTVGIFSFDGYKSSDVDLFYSRTGTSSNVPINNVLVNGFSGLCGDGGDGCDDGEQVLDIVNVIGMAPGIAQILFYEGDSGPDILNRMATDDLAKVISCSWGSGDLGHATDPIFMEFQAQGQTFASATGDDGSYDASAWAPPSLNSLILQVGGTNLTTDGPGGPWQAESSWPDSGGGFYNPAGYAIPDYQQLSGVITASNAGSTTLRNDPDVAAEGNFDNPTVSNGQFLTGYGGTSFAAPRWAGYIALANEQSIANGTGVLGFVNPAVYDIGTGANYADNFHDITSGSNGGFHAVAGFDLVTGWGSPVEDALIGALSGSTTNAGFVLGAYPVVENMTRTSDVVSTISVAALNGFADPVDLTISGLPDGVTASFDPATATTSSTLTLTSNDSATIGHAMLTVTGTSDGLTQTTAIHLLVGNPPAATIDDSVTFEAVVPLGNQDRTIAIGDADDSVPLTYTATAHSSSDGSCSGDVDWLTLPVGSGTLNGGETGGIAVIATPAAASLAPGQYSGEICIATNDAAHANVVVPVAMTVVPGPASDTMFLSGFESGESGTVDTGLFTFNVDMPAEDSQAGSALDLATGNFHTWSAAVVDNINPYDDGTGLQVYWYNDVVPGAFRNRVGGVVDSGDYAVLQSGDTIGPDSTFSNAISPMTNWWSGVDGYVGIAFYNSQTHVLNYGYIHMTTTAPTGFPVEVLDYGFDNTGAAVTIP